MNIIEAKALAHDILCKHGVKNPDLYKTFLVAAEDFSNEAWSYEFCLEEAPVDAPDFLVRAFDSTGAKKGTPTQQRQLVAAIKDFAVKAAAEYA